MQKLKNSLNGTVICLFELIVGILLLINPIGFTTGIIIAAGIILMIVGLINVIKYFKVDVAEASMGQYLMKGLLALLTGLFCIFKARWVIITFPALTIIYGVVLFIAGLSKVQLTFDMLRKKNKKWFLAVISAIISIICSVLIINKPFVTTAALWIIIGITLIVEAVIDFVTMIFNKKGNKSPEEESEENKG